MINAHRRCTLFFPLNAASRNSPPEVFIGKGVLVICSKFKGEHPYRSVISIKLICSFIEITLWHGYSPVNLLHIFRTTFPKNTPGGLLLNIIWFHDEKNLSSSDIGFRLNILDLVLLKQFVAIHFTLFNSMNIVKRFFDETLCDSCKV